MTRLAGFKSLIFSSSRVVNRKVKQLKRSGRSFHIMPLLIIILLSKVSTGAAERRVEKLIKQLAVWLQQNLAKKFARASSSSSSSSSGTLARRM